MSTDMATGQYRQRGPSSAGYSQPENFDYDNTQGADTQGYYTNQSVSSPPSALLDNVRSERMDADSVAHQYYSPYDNDALRYTAQGTQAPITTPSSHQTTTLPYHARSHSAAEDQYDGPPTIPARTTSQNQGSPPRAPAVPSTAPLEARVAATRHARQHAPESQAGRVQNRAGGSMKKHEIGLGRIQLRLPHLLHVAEERVLLVPKVHIALQTQENELSTMLQLRADLKQPCTLPTLLLRWRANTAM